MNFFQKIARHKWELFFLVVICAIGIMFRTYNHDKWLHFEVDQTWDYHIVSNAVTGGIGNLPLLGPTAGGGRSLRLGPAFYYMEYVSALLFGNTPVGHSMTVLILSILSLPLFYIFVRRYFSVLISAGLLMTFSTSLYLVLYARFSWSPNVLPFFALLTFYALLRSVSKSEKHPRIWFLIMVLTAGISTQIHFNAFFTFPAIIITFLIIKRPKFELKTWGAAILIMFILYSPVIINEIKTRGEDLKYFVEKLDKNASHRKNFLEKTFLVTQYNAYEYFLILSGNDQINGFSNPDGYSLGIACKSTCLSRLPIRIPVLIYFFIGVFLLFRRTKREFFAEKKDFLILSLLWFIFSFLYFYAIYSSNILFPRFFLIVSPLPIILLGLILETICPQKNKASLAVFSLIIAGFAYSNTTKIFNHFSDLGNAATTETSAKMKDVFPNNKRVTLEQEQLVANYMASKHSSNQYPVYFFSDHEYAPSLWYLLSQQGIQYFDEFFISPEKEAAYAKANYFLIYRTNQISQKDVSNFSDNFSIIEKKKFGSLTAFYLAPKNGKDNLAKQTPTITTQQQQILGLMTWNKLARPISQQTISDESEISNTPETSGEDLP
ncbi:MAG: glycosyltransferase family 39 protein [Candidatus Moraniibacteriota bacterium]